MPLPPKPPPDDEEPPDDELPPLLPLLELDELPMPPMPLLPLELEPELDETPAEPRVPADVDPALRLAVPDDELGTDEMLLPADDAATVPAAAADLAVAALTRADESAADLLVAATPPPVPDA